MKLKAAVATTAASLALGAAGSARANVVGGDSQIFNPVAGATAFVTVHSSATLAPGRFSLGLFANHAANALPYAAQPEAATADTLTGADAALAAGLLPGLELGVAAPFIIRQSVTDGVTRGEFEERGNTDVKGILKWRALGGAGGGLALIGSATFNRTRENPTTGTATGPIYNAELAGDLRLAAVTLGANAGYRWRSGGQELDGALVSPLANQVLASMAATIHLTPRTGLVAEAYGARPVTAPRNDSDRKTETAEALLGVRHRWANGLTGHAGGGKGLLHGLATPDWRVYLGLVAETGPGKADGETTTAQKKKKARKQRPAPAPAADEAAPLLAAYPPDADEPPAAELPQGEPDEVFVLHNINFEFDSDFRVLPGALSELEKLQRHLAARPASRIVVEGHTDYFGTDEYNDSLSTRRARTVRRHLVRHYGFDPTVLHAVGYGERRPWTPDTSDAGRQLNRRVEIKIYRD